MGIDARIYGTVERDRASEFTPLETPSVFSPVHKDGDYSPLVNQFLANIHTSSYFVTECPFI